jgi:hypothetical protein
MGFSNRSLCGVVLTVLLSGRCLAQMSATNVRVLVYDSAHIPAKVVEIAGSEAARIFQEAGIRLAWVNCSDPDETAECGAGPVRGQFSLHIIPDGQTSTKSVYGEAFLGTDGTGTYADVFFGRVEQAHWELRLNVAQLLGAVAAHEIGHLLLGFHAHSWVGIMAPVWESGSLHNLRMGRLFFTHEQAEQMKERSQNRQLRFAELETK